jgi:hypothetical protein
MMPCNIFRATLPTTGPSNKGVITQPDGVITMEIRSDHGEGLTCPSHPFSVSLKALLLLLCGLTYMASAEFSSSPVAVMVNISMMFDSG